jgi:hypothetical protein
LQQVHHHHHQRDGDHQRFNHLADRGFHKAVVAGYIDGETGGHPRESSATLARTAAAVFSASAPGLHGKAGGGWPLAWAVKE